MVSIGAALPATQGGAAPDDLSLITERIMKCPNCPDVTLSLTERQGVELDYCPQCRGVWLDRGELDKLIERSGNARHRDESEVQAGRHQGQHGDYAPRRAHDRHDGHERRRKSWLGDLFD
jgi:Zn-finger nucleic acid-binding protein